MTKKVFLFVHGAYHSGGCWEKVAEKLSEKGHIVHTPTLPGHGKDDKKDIDLNDYVNFLKDYINKNNLKDVYLVGHSLGGLVISHILSKEIKKYIFISGLALKKGENFLDYLPERVKEKYLSIYKDNQNAIPPNLEYAKNTFLNGCEDENLIKETLSKFVSQPIKPYFNEAQLDFLSVQTDVDYIICKNDLAVPKEMLYKIKENLPKTTRFLELESDHEPMVSMPEELADLLDQS